MTSLKLRFLLLGALLPAAGLFVSGCAHSVTVGNGLTWIGSGREFQPQNYHQTSAWLPRDLRRVAVLPLTNVPTDNLSPASIAQLDRLLPGELSRTELFEVVDVTPDQLRRWTGRSRWNVTDELPADFFERIHNQLGCDGVVFAHLTAYHPYPPLAMGWKLSLVDARQPQIWWSCDLMYDAGDQGVARSAVRYEREHELGRIPEADPATILRSPGRFGQYTLAASLGTLQRHEKNN